MKIEMDKTILEEIKKKIIDYLLKNNYINLSDVKYIRQRLDAMKTLYVENLKETKGCRMVCRSNEIAIDEHFVELTPDKKNVIRLKDNFKNVVLMQLCHELWHAASMFNGISGIRKNKNYTALNEGITQMFTEEIHGFTLSKYTDSTYRHFKYIAKILMLSSSRNTVLNSYINNMDDLMTFINNISNDLNCYDFLNEHLTNMFNILRYIRINEKEEPKEFNRILGDIYTNKMTNMYKYILLKIVIPRLNQLSNEQQKIYIRNILSIIKEDNEVYEIINNYLNTTFSMNSDEIEKEIIKINNNLVIKQDQLMLIKNLFDDKGNLLNTQFTIKNDGTIIYHFDKGNVRVNNPSLCEMIYTQLYLNRPFNIDMESIDFSKRCSINVSTLNVLQKRKLFCGLKHYYEKNGYYILNSFEEFDDKDQITISIVKKESIPSFDDLKQFTFQFQPFYEMENNTKITKFINKKTNKVVADENIVNTLSFILIWIKACKNNGINAFDNSIINFYNELMQQMQNSIYNTGDLNIDSLLEKYQNTKYINILKEMFYSSKNYETIYNFMILYTDEEKRTMQYKKEKSIEEKRYGDSKIIKDTKVLSDELHEKDSHIIDSKSNEYKNEVIQQYRNLLEKFNRLKETSIDTGILSYKHKINDIYTEIVEKSKSGFTLEEKEELLGLINRMEMIIDSKLTTKTDSKEIEDKKNIIRNIKNICDSMQSFDDWKSQYSVIAQIIKGTDLRKVDIELYQKLLNDLEKAKEEYLSSNETERSFIISDLFDSINDDLLSVGAKDINKNNIDLTRDILGQKFFERQNRILDIINREIKLVESNPNTSWKVESMNIYKEVLEKINDIFKRVPMTNEHTILLYKDIYDKLKGYRKYFYKGKKIDDNTLIPLRIAQEFKSQFDTSLTQIEILENNYNKGTSK